MLADPKGSIDERLRALAEYAGSDHPDTVLVSHIVRKVDSRALEALREKYRYGLEHYMPDGPLKYLDLVAWTYRKLRLARRLGLDSGRPLTILDLGAGGAHFARVCRHFGHTVVSTDIHTEFYDDVAALLGVERTRASVEPGIVLPDFGCKFDLVTAIAIIFDQVQWNVRYWSLDQWKFLLNDLLARQLRFPGRIYLELNRQKDGKYNSEFLRYCANSGASTTNDGAIDWSFPQPSHLA